MGPTLTQSTEGIRTQQEVGQHKDDLNGTRQQPEQINKQRKNKLIKNEIFKTEEPYIESLSDYFTGAIDKHPIQRWVAMLQVTSCYLKQISRGLSATLAIV